MPFIMPQGSFTNQSDPTGHFNAGSVLASLQNTASHQGAQWTLTSDLHFRVSTVVCCSVLALILILRLVYLRRHSDVTGVYHCLVPGLGHIKARKYMYKRCVTHMFSEDYENTFVGVSLPLLQEVTTI